MFACFKKQFVTQEHCITCVHPSVPTFNRSIKAKNLPKKPFKKQANFFGNVTDLLHINITKKTKRMNSTQHKKKKQEEVEPARE